MDMRIVVVEDLRMFREAIVHACQHDFGHEVVGETGSGIEALTLCARHTPDALVLDLQLDDIDGFAVVQHLRERPPAPRILMFSSHCEDYMLFRVEQMGAHGFVSKIHNPLAVIGEALSAIEAGRTFFCATFHQARRARQNNPLAYTKTLTEWERTILGLIGHGFSDEEIATRLGMSPRTTQGHRSHIMQKLGIKGTPKLMAYAILNGFTQPYPPTAA